MVKKTLIITGIAVALAALAGLAVSWYMRDASAPLTERVLKVNRASVVVEVADTVASQVQGLSGRSSLAPDRGMLFVYPDQQVRNFWMKDMRFPIDVVWIADSKVVGVEESVPHQSDDGEVVRFTPDAPADMALEVNAGWIRDNGIATGDSVSVTTE